MESRLSDKYLEDVRLAATFPELCEVRPGLVLVQPGNSALILDLLDEICILRKENRELKYPYGTENYVGQEKNAPNTSN